MGLHSQAFFDNDEDIYIVADSTLWLYMWTIIGVVATFLMIFVLVIRKVNIGVALVLGSVILGLLSLPLAS